MKIYIAGRITGNPHYKAQFKATKTMLQEAGHTVLNPAELPEGMKPADYMRICFAMLETADVVLFQLIRMGKIVLADTVIQF
jgi:nucleoside 2-deoxyribosyltransferase